MFPYVYSSDEFVIGSYGLFLAIAYLTGRWYFLKNLETKVPTSSNLEILIVLLLVFGVAGAKLMFILKNPDKSELLFSGTGFSSQGALLGALISTFLYTQISKMRLNLILDSAAPAAILAYAIARIGCFMSGDDCHGIPTDLPWGMSFPNGIEPTSVPVHPVPLYEIVYSLGIFLLLVKRQKQINQPYSQFFLLLGLWGICRFLVEFVSTNHAIWQSMSGSQIGAIFMAVLSGLYFLNKKLN